MAHPAGAFLARLILLALLPANVPASNSDQPEVKWDIGIRGVYKTRCTFPVKVTVDVDSRRAAGMEAIVVMGKRDPRGGTLHPLRMCRAPFVTGSAGRGLSAVLSARLSQSCNTVQLHVVEGKRTISRRTLDLAPVDDRVVCVLTQECGRFDVLGSLEQVTHLCVTGEDIPPNGHMLESVDVLIVDSFDLSSLDKARLDAINLWALSGGVMVFTSDGLLKNAGSHSPMPLRDVKVGALASSAPPPAFLSYLDLRAPVVPVKSVPRLGMELPDGWEKLIEDPAGPWLASRRWGIGRVFLDATQLEGVVAGTTLTPRDLRRELWDAVLSTPPVGRDLTAEFGTEDRDFYNVPREAQVSGVMSSVFGFLLICLIVLGPVNYMVLKKLDRREYILATVPAVVILLAGGAYLISWVLRGGEAVVSVANLTIGMPGQSGVSRSYLGYLAPDTEPSQVRVRNPDGFAVMFRDEIEGHWREADRVGRHPLHFAGTGDELRISNFCMNKWAMRFLRFDSIDAIHSGIRVEASLSARLFSGRVINATTMILKKAHLLTRYHSVPLGDLAPGAVAEWSLDPTRPSSEKPAEEAELRHTTMRRTGLGRSEKELLFKAIETYPAVGYAAALVYTFGDGAPLRIDAGTPGARYEGINVGITTVPYHLAPGPLSIPMGFNSVYHLRGTQRTPAGPGQYGGSSDGDRDALEFDLPIETSFLIPIEGLKVHLGRSKTQCGAVECPPPAPARVHLYDWAQREYVQVGVSKGWEDTIDVASPARFVGLPGARIRVQIERAPGADASLEAPDFSMAGSGFDEPVSGALNFHYVDVSLSVGKQPDRKVDAK